MRVEPETADGGRVLVVEDDVDTGQMLCELLRRERYHVEWVKRGREALKRLGDEERAADLDVVLLDLMLPDVDGATIAAHVARLAQRPAVIIVSSRAAGSIARQPGVLRAFRKPFDVGRLLQTLAYAVAPKSPLDDELLSAACATLRARPPKLGVADEATWELAERVVQLALARVPPEAWNTAPYEVQLSLRAYRAAEHAERSVSETYIPDGGRTIDCAVGDMHGYAVLQLALSVAAWVASQTAPTGVA